jgi:hypothetical protein
LAHTCMLNLASQFVVAEVIVKLGSACMDV